MVRLFAAWGGDVWAQIVIGFGGLHDRLRQGRMGMDGQRHILHNSGHLHRQDPLSDQFASSRAGDADAENSFALRIDDKFRDTVAPSLRRGSARCRSLW